MGQVAGPVHLGLVRRDMFAVLVAPPVDVGRQRRQLGQHPHGVVEHGVPEFGLGHAFAVSPREDRVVLHGHDAHRELGHGMGVDRHRVQRGLGVVGHRLVLAEDPRDLAHVVVGGDLPRQQQVEHALGQRLLPARGLGQSFLQLGDAVAAEADPLVGIDRRRLGDHALDAAHAAVGLLDRDLGDLVVPVLLHQPLDLVAGSRDRGGQFLLQRGRGGFAHRRIPFTLAPHCRSSSSSCGTPDRARTSTFPDTSLVQARSRTGHGQRPEKGIYHPYWTLTLRFYSGSRSIRGG